MTVHKYKLFIEWFNKLIPEDIITGQQKISGRKVNLIHQPRNN